MKKLTIKRSRWIRGVREGEFSFLRREADGKMCCLGFYALSCGLSPALIADVAEPKGLMDKEIRDEFVLPEDFDWLLRHGKNSPDANVLMEINDGTGIDDEEREAAVAAEFAKHGVDVMFVD